MDTYAKVFLAARVLYPFAYAAFSRTSTVGTSRVYWEVLTRGQATIRSLIWFVGIGATLGLMKRACTQ